MLMYKLNDLSLLQLSCHSSAVSIKRSSKSPKLIQINEHYSIVALKKCQCATLRHGHVKLQFSLYSPAQTAQLFSSEKQIAQIFLFFIFFNT